MSLDILAEFDPPAPVDLLSEFDPPAQPDLLAEFEPPAVEVPATKTEREKVDEMWVSNLEREVAGGAAAGVADIAGGAAGFLAAPGRNTQSEIAKRAKRLAELEAVPSVFDKFSQDEIANMQAAPAGFRTPKDEAEIASLRDTIGNLRGVLAKESDWQGSVEDFQKLASAAAEESKTFFGQDPAKQDEFLSKLARGAGSLPPYIAAGMAGGPVASMLVGGLQSGQAEYNAAIEAGKPELAQEAFEKGLFIGLTEGVGVGGGLGEAKKQFAQKAFQTLKKGVEEGGQEFVQNTLSNLNASTGTGYDPRRETLEGAGEAAAIGFILGGGVEGGSQAIRSEKVAEAGLPRTAAMLEKTAPPTAPVTPPITAPIVEPPSPPPSTNDTGIPPSDAEIEAAINEGVVDDGQPSAPIVTSGQPSVAPAAAPVVEKPGNPPLESTIAPAEPEAITPAAPPAAEPSALPTLREGENQGDLLSKQTEDLTLVGEQAVDFAKRKADREKAEAEEAEFRRIQDEAQRDLFAELEQEDRQRTEAELEEGMETNHYELLDSVKSLGGLPALSEKGSEASGEIRRILEANPNTKGRVAAMQLTRKGADSLETLRENLNDRGFDFATPYDMLSAIEESIASGKKRYGTKVSPDQLAFSYAPRESGAVTWHRGPNHRSNIVRVVESLKRAVEGVRVRVLTNESELPPEVRATLDPNGRYEGLVDTRNGDVWLFSDRIRNGQRAAEVFAHEVVGHFGVEKIIDPKEWAAIAQSIIKRGGPQLGFVLNRNFPETAVEDLSADERATLAREYVATVAENPATDRSLWERIVAAVRAGLRKIGVVREWSEEDIRALISAGARAVQDTGKSRRVGDGGYQSSKAHDQTRTPAFKRWFGNSKVVDENGSPLVVYKGMWPYDWTHETKETKGPRIESIQRSGGFPAFNRGEEDVPNVAGFFGDAKTASHFASIMNGSVFPVYLSLQNPYEIDARGRKAGTIQFGESGQEFRDAMRSGKYDGAIIRNTADEGTVFVTARADQAKSAIANSGAFDPSNPNLLGSRLPTSTKNAVTDAERAARSAPEILAEATITNQETLDRARADIAANPNRGAEVVARLLSGESVRNISVDEEAILLVEKVRLMEERDAQGERSSNPELSEAERAVAHTEWTALEAKLNEMDQATHASGAEWGRMGQFRQRLLAADFTFEAMEGRARKAKGEPLTADESARIKAQAVEIARLEGELAELRVKLDEKARAEAFTEAHKEISKEAAEEPAESAEVEPHVASLADRIRTALDREAAKALARIRKRRAEGRLNALPVNELADYAIYGASKIASGLIRKSQWAAAMIADLGNDVSPFLDEIWDASNKKLDAVVEKVAKGDKTKTKRAVRKLDPQAGVDRVTEGMKKRLEDGDEIHQLGGLIRSLAKQFVKAGITEREALLDAVHGVVAELAPDFTRRETMDAISGYGDFKALDQTPLAVTLRDLRGQMQQVAKIEDMMAKQAPRKTGVERRTPSDEERRLIKEVNELKKKGGFVVTDPAAQLKSAMDAVKTRLRNEISDLDHAIATKAPLKGKKGAPAYDAEAQALKAQRDAKKAQYDALFPKAPLSPAEQLARVGRALDRSIELLAADIKAGKLYADPAAPKLTSPQLDAKRARLETLRAERDMLRDLDTDRNEAEKEAALQEQIAALQARIAKDETDAKAGAPTADTAEVARLKAERDALSKAIADRRKAKLPQKTEEEKRIKAIDKELEKLRKKVASGDTSVKIGKPWVPGPELAARLLERDMLNAQLAALRAGPKRTKDQIALANFKARTARKIAELSDRIARKDFGPKAKPVPVAKDAEADRLAFELNEKKKTFSQGLFDWQLANRTRGRVVLDFTRDVLNTARALMTSFDLSAVLRQGGFIAVGNPVRAAKNIPAMLRAATSKAEEFKINSEILSRPNAGLYQQSGLYLHDPNDPRLSRMEEAYMSRWAEKIPGVGASQRAYTTFLNRLRADTFDAMIAGLTKGGTPTADEAKVIANYVNVASGRGNLGMNAMAAVTLNTVFFSPRYLASRFQLLAGQPAWGGNARTRTAIAKEYGKFLAGMAVVYALAQAAGADDMEDDPKSPDFGKLKFGNTRIDPLAGLAQVTRFSAQTIDNLTKVFSGDKLKRGAGDYIGRFLRSKLSPQLGTAVDLAYGENLVHEQVTPLTAAQKLVVPLTFGDVKKAIEEQGIPGGTAIALLALLGWGAQTYESKRRKDD